MDHISFSFDLDKKYALVGASGSGKSTLAKIITGFLRPDAGQITLNGLPINQLKECSLYDVISYQSQTVSFFNDTIKNNILLGNKIPDDEWQKIIRDSRLENMLDRLPEHENAVIGENGKNISGGEAQRIGLARCLAKHSPFIIFDEIAASIDNQNALEIEKTILSLKDVGVLMITHRIYEEMMRNYDLIFVLKNGKMTEQGTWDELIRKKGDFYKLAIHFDKDSQ